MSDHAILEWALTGKPLCDTFVIDCHGHLDFWKPAFPLKVSLEGIIGDMDRIGIDMVCLNKWNCPDVKRANDDIGQAVAEHPERVIGFASAAPCLGREAVTDELKRCFDELGHRGMKVHVGYESLPMRDRRTLPEHKDALEAVWEFAAERRCPVLCHGFISPEVAKRYPEAIFLRAHAGGSKSDVWTYADHPNFYLDTSCSGTLRGSIEYMVENGALDRIVYGSDLPYADPAYRIGQVIGTRLTDEPLRKILGLNMARVLGVEVPKRYR